MLVVTISVFTILGAMGALSIMALPDEPAEPAAELADGGPAASESDEPEAALEYTTTEDLDPASREGVAALWHEAGLNNDFATLERHTCANPSARVAGVLLAAQAAEARSGDYTVPGVYVTSREYNGATEVATFLNAQDPTYDYIWEKEPRPGDIIVIMTLVEEDGAWKVCDGEGIA